MDGQNAVPTPAKTVKNPKKRKYNESKTPAAKAALTANFTPINILKAKRKVRASDNQSRGKQQLIRDYFNCSSSNYSSVTPSNKRAKLINNPELRIDNHILDESCASTNGDSTIGSIR